MEVVWTPWSLDRAFVLRFSPISLDVRVDLPAPELPTKREHLSFKKFTSSPILSPFFAEQLMTLILIFL